MTTKSSNPIIGIRLEGFQVFDKPTYIPLNRLTMLFGPNSAGKSAVQDAIELYAALMENDNSGISRNSPKVSDLLHRHWRRAGTGDESRASHLSIEIKHTTACDVHAVLTDELDRKRLADFSPRNGRWLELESRWHFDKPEHEDTGFAYEETFSFYLESSLFVRCNDSELFVNLTHPLLGATELKVDFDEVAKLFPNSVTLIDGNLGIRGLFLGFHPAGYSKENDRENWLRYYPTTDQDSRSIENLSLLAAAIKEINLLIGSVLHAANGNSRFHPYKVDASRMVPTRQDLTFQIGNLEDAMQPGPDKENAIYRSLAESLASELTNIQTHFVDPEMLKKHPNLPSPTNRRKYADAVNHALADHLFMEQGYRLDYDFRLLMSKQNSKYGLEEGMGLDTSEFGFLVELILRDSKGRNHRFEDVGSGIGYLLPVLCAVYEKNHSASSACFIQQPELHIHPALQAAMGDVFIEGSEEEHQLVIETHSEHLLLRVLKRIRQTHLQVAISPELRIEADEVCVLYFDPTPEGTTTVKRLRITEDGEFMDRWPRGFFGERDMELLDE